MKSADFFELPDTNPDELSPAVWAYIGDAVYELFIRCYLLADGPAKTKTLHHEATTMVRASFQARLASQIESSLTADELEILKRGRNVKSGHIPNHTDVLTYRHSTAFEALIGYLYLRGQQNRLNELLTLAMHLGQTSDNPEN
jgi:ribonuclease-3 family protein